MEMDDDIDDWDSAYFVGPCTCDHEPDDHGWFQCNMASCPCDAHWEE